MNCRQAEQLCSYNRDHALSQQQSQTLQQHMDLCPACRRREHRYRELVTALSVHRMPDPEVDLMQLALARVEKEKADPRALPTSRWSGLFGKENRTMLRNLTMVVLAGALAGTVLLETYPQKAQGQAVLRKMQRSITQATTLHHATWAYLQNEVEAKTHTWQDGKKPVRFDTWLTRDAMRGGDELNGPYLWTAKGYLHYDRNVNKVNYMNPGPEVPLKAAIDDAFNPIARMRRSAPPGTYLSVKRLDDTLWQARRVYKIQIASGQTKPAVDEEVTAQEPGKTPPISQSAFVLPNVRVTYWVDKATDLPVYSEEEKQIPQRWVLLSRDEYDYTGANPPALLDTDQVRKELEAFGAARQKRH